MKPVRVMGGKVVACESVEQSTLFQVMALAALERPELGLLFAIPNGAYTSPEYGARLKREGVKAGVPDVMLPVARGRFHGLFIEMKRREGGRVDPLQKQWAEAFSAQGYKAVTCRGWCEARQVILDYLNQ